MHTFAPSDCATTGITDLNYSAVQYALKYIASCWDADLVSNIIGVPGQPRRMGGPSSPENVTLLAIIIPDNSEARKPALSSISTIKQALAALTSLIQVRFSSAPAALPNVQSVKQRGKVIL